MKYPFKEIEKKWQSFWDEHEVDSTDLSDKEKSLYTLVMFIYPSGSKTHIGHWYNYGPADTWARYRKLKGFNVFEPMGYDAFGLPAENYAIKTGVHPKDSTLKNIADIKDQLKSMGCMYDWNAELMTCDPEYYRWNQWLFLKLYEKGLAYRKNAPVNWCPSCQTVLANEQVQNDGTCERCGTLVEQKNLTQWFFKITDYAEELLKGLEKIEWPEKTKVMQQNWIGKSYGAEIAFDIADSDERFTVFTTRPDTLFGATYMVLSPEHSLVNKITSEEQKEAVEDYQNKVKNLSEIDRTSTVKEKTGVFTGAYAINPGTKKKIPIWIADYVLVTYGTGAIMAVPGQDERDWEFAEKFDLPIIRTVKPPDDYDGKAYIGEGPAINSDFLNGLYIDEAKKKIVEWLEEHGLGSSKVNFRLRDWLISRQRYWGTPIPIIYCDDCGEVAVPESELPVELPYEVEFNHDGGSPLAGNSDFVNTSCPQCGKSAKREVDTMDTFVDSSWYYLRYLNTKSEKIFDKNLADNWTPVDMYIGGAEHATMHLLYARFIHKFLRDLGLVNSDEPFQRLVHQGTITNQGAKMSKSKGNVVDPGSFIDQYGADVFRMYLMFMGPYDLGGDWSDKGIVGVDRFVQRTYSLFENYKNYLNDYSSADSYEIDELNASEKDVYRKVNITLDKYEQELENLRFNTAVASLMELLNELTKSLSNCSKNLVTFSLERFAYMLAPLAPHLGEECWQILGGEKSLFQNPRSYSVDEKALTVDSVTVVVQVNGKIRAKMELPADSNESVVKERAWSDENVKNHTDGKTTIKEIYVKNKIYNIVVK
ncbi:MAG: leucine--tRNA ligase [Melioribacteraceae bacterium]|nr:leucine--tRNA ligase [Melioribacteraceae bacterium]